MSSSQSDVKDTKPTPGRAGLFSARNGEVLIHACGGREARCRGERSLDDAKTRHAPTNQDWQTKAGTVEARHGKTMKQHLANAAWKLIGNEERHASDRAELSQAERSAANTGAVRTAQGSSTQRDPRSLNEEQLKRLTKTELVQIARNEELPNRSKMNKAQLARTLRKHFRQPS